MTEEKPITKSELKETLKEVLKESYSSNEFKDAVEGIVKNQLAGFNVDFLMKTEERLGNKIDNVGSGLNILVDVLEDNRAINVKDVKKVRFATEISKT
jgi:hypothetical protein